MKRLFNAFLILFTVSLIGCADFLEEKVVNKTPESAGNVVISLGSNARTVSPEVPSEVDLTQIEWTVYFAQGTASGWGTIVEFGKINGLGSKNFSTQMGVYKITVEGSFTTASKETFNYYGEATNVVVGQNPVNVNITVGLKKAGKDADNTKLSWKMKVAKGGVPNDTTVYFYAGRIIEDSNGNIEYRYINNDKGTPINYSHKFTSTDTEPVNIKSGSENQLYLNKIPAGYHRLFFKYSYDAAATPDKYILMDLGDNLVEIADGETTTFERTVTMPSSTTRTRTYYVSDKGSENNSGLFKSYPTTFNKVAQNILNDTTFETFEIQLDSTRNSSTTQVCAIDISALNNLVSKLKDKNYEITLDVDGTLFENEDGTLEFDYNGNNKLGFSFTASDSSNTKLSIKALDFSKIENLAFSEKAKLVLKDASGKTVNSSGNELPVKVSVDDFSFYNKDNPFLKYSVNKDSIGDVYFVYELENAEINYTEKQDFIKEATPENPNDETFVRSYIGTVSVKPTTASRTMLWSKENDSSNYPMTKAYLTNDVTNKGNSFLGESKAIEAWGFDNDGVLYYVEKDFSMPTFEYVLYKKAANEDNSTKICKLGNSALLLAASDSTIYILDSQKNLYSYDKNVENPVGNVIGKFARIFQNYDITAIYAQGGTIYAAAKFTSLSIVKIYELKQYVLVNITPSLQDYKTYIYEKSNIDASPATIFGANKPNSPNYKITDLQVVDQNLYALICDTFAKATTGEQWGKVYSRGALIKIKNSILKTVGLYDSSEFTEYSVKVTQQENSATLASTFTGPRRFIARKPDELVIADDGTIRKTGNVYPDYNRVITVDLLNEMSFKNVTQTDVRFSTLIQEGDSADCAYFE
ncbi:hypothetical protein [Treponema pectinovorum]|uniref:hypothetical protein n=1 Tax=Treponema pectinovorum TaxID=164 RepID=UPI0011CBE4A6|nr:hypothetical protein [Treponema pectinovorum]